MFDVIISLRILKRIWINCKQLVYKKQQQHIYNILNNKGSSKRIFLLKANYWFDTLHSFLFTVRK